MNEYTADFETQERNGVREVWLFAICNINTLSIKIGYEISEFIKSLEKLPNNSTVSFHNLRYDGSYLLTYLLRVGWVCDTSKKPFTFSTLISDYGVHYSYSLFFPNGKKIKIIDSLKIFTMTVSEIAKTFNFEEKKGIIDYTKFHNDFRDVTNEEIEYIENDVLITAKAMKIFRDLGYKKNTIASNALKTFKTIEFGEKYWLYRQVFPKLSNDEFEFIAKAYKGGFCFVNPKFINKELKSGFVLDVNSLYPFSMSRKDKLYPYGKGEYFEGKYTYSENKPLYIQHIQSIFKLKQGFIPTIQIKNSPYFNQVEYLKSSNNLLVDLWLTDVDLKIFLDHYNIKSIYYIDGYKYSAIKSPFINYIEKFKKDKEDATKEGNSGKRLISKLFLNSLYGKFGAKDNKRCKIPYIDDVGNLHYKLEISEKGQETQYIPMACYITAYAREYILSFYQKHYKDVAYCDTDSLHFISSEIPEDIPIHNSQFGSFDCELKFTRAKFLGAKTYIEEYTTKEGEKKLKIKCAGLPKADEAITVNGEKISFDNFKYGAEFKTKKSKMVEGGIDIYETTFEIRERKK